MSYLEFFKKRSNSLLEEKFYFLVGKESGFHLDAIKSLLSLCL